MATMVLNSHVHILGNDVVKIGSKKLESNSQMILILSEKMEKPNN